MKEFSVVYSIISTIEIEDTEDIFQAINAERRAIDDALFYLPGIMSVNDVEFEEVE